MKIIYFLIMFVLVLLMCFYLFATSIIGGYLIGDELYMNQLVFPTAQTGRPTVGDQVLYAFKVSGYPYYALLCLFGMIVLTLFYRKQRKSK